MEQEQVIENEAVNEVETDEISQEVLDLQEKARQYGWSPKENWRGKPEDWVDAEEFNEKFVPAIRANRQSHQELKNELEKVKSTTAEAMEILKRSHAAEIERKETEIKGLIKDLKTRHREAIRNGDDDEADQIEAEMENLHSASSDLKKTSDKDNQGVNLDPEMTRAFQEWVRRNDWLTTDEELRDYAIYYGDKLEKEGNNPVGKEFFQLVEDKVKKTFPHKFENQNRNRPNAVESGGVPATQKRKKTSNDLPPEHRQMMKEMIAQGHLTEQQYLDNYQW